MTVSQENVQIVIDGVAAYKRRDLDALSEYWTDYIAHRWPRARSTTMASQRGKDALRAYLQDWPDTFEALTVEPLELIDAGGRFTDGDEFRPRGRSLQP
jgi:ketosteroid isomerase-like protein